MKFNILFLFCLLMTGFHLQAQETLEPDDVFEFEEKAQEKVRDLGTYISIIADKDSYSEDVEDAKELALDLFISSDRIVEVSSIGNAQVSNYEIERYLNRLQLLNYTKVNIEWYDIFHVSDLYEGPDGNYYGAITLYQKFTGFMGDDVAYTDVTEKTIEVILQHVFKTVGGIEEDYWDVLLGDVKVVETRDF